MDKYQIGQGIENGLKWLAESEIYQKTGTETGGLRSKYDPKTKQYEVWAGGITDSLCTSGFVEVAILYQQQFGVNTYSTHINQSAHHLRKLWNDDENIMWAGLNSKSIYPLWAGQTANALYLHASHFKIKESLEIANKIVKWLISIQNDDGSIPRDQIWSGKIKRNPVASWNTWLITTLLEADKNRVQGALAAAERLGNWMLKVQNSDGSFNYNYGSIKSAWRNIRDLGKNGYGSIFKSISTTTLWRHPTSQAHSLFSALQLYEKTKDVRYLNSALKVHAWIEKNLSENHLFFENYWLKQHSVQEDVYPTAIVAMTDNRLHELKKDDKYLNQSIEIMKTIINSQYKSSDPNLDGAFPGVPLEPAEGHKAYAWDTIGAIKSLVELYQLKIN